MANLEPIGERHCYWAPDFSYTSLLKPINGTALRISNSLRLTGQDAADQTLAIGASTTLQFGINDILGAGTWPVPSTSQVILIENLRGYILARDTAAQIQVQMVQCNLGDGITSIGIAAQPSAPVTLPAVVNIGPVFVALLPIPLLLPRPAGSSTGPFFVLTVKNLDGAAAHIYRRNIGFTYRIIDNVDLSSGIAVRGSA